MLLIQELIGKLSTWDDYSPFAFEDPPNFLKGFFGVEESGGEGEGFRIELMRLRANKSNIFAEFDFVLKELKDGLIDSWDDENKLLVAGFPDVVEHILVVLHILSGVPDKLVF